MTVPSRRQLLTIFAANLPLSVAGCSSQEARPTQTPSTTPDQSSATYEPENGKAGPAPSCSGGAERFEPWWVVIGNGPAGGFELRSSKKSLNQGQSLTVTLQNVTDQPQSSGNRRKFDLQYKRTGGWHTIFDVEGEAAWTDIGIEHQPGTAFKWTFKLSREGIVTFLDKFDRSAYKLCSPINPGKYRFVYWGITSEREEKENFETDYALGVPFEVI